MWKVILALSCFVLVCESASIERNWLTELTLYKDCLQGPFDIVFVLDSSSSLKFYETFEQAREFVTSLIEPFDIGPQKVRVGIMMYGYGVYTNPGDVYFLTNNQNKADIDSFIDNLTWQGGNQTDTGLGIEFMREKIMSKGRTGVRHICIVITDGESRDRNKTVNEAKLARDAGIRMLAVGVGFVNKNELNEIAGDPSYVHYVDTYSELDEIRADLLGDTCEKEKPKPTNKPCCCNKDEN